MSAAPRSAVFVTALLLLAALGGAVRPLQDAVDTVGSAPDPSGEGRASRATEWTYNFSVKNPTSLPRGPEMAWVEVGVPPGIMHDVGEVSLFNRDTSEEMQVGILSADFTNHPDGSIHEVSIHFNDWWDADETRNYRAVLGRRSQVTGGPMSVSTSGEFVIVNDGNRQYQVHIEDSVFSQAQGLYYLYVLSGELRAHGSVLTRVGGNQLEPDQASFQMWWGQHTFLGIQRSPLAARLILRYEQPEIVHWGPAGATVQQIVRYPDLISAEVVLTFYKGIPRIDVHSRKTINERFWNHNGFVMEFSAILGSGADWQGEFETVFGTDIHRVMTTTTQGPTWTRQSTAWQGIDLEADAAPAFYDLDADGDLDMVVGSESTGLHVYENVGDSRSAQMVENTSWAEGLPDLPSPTPTLGDLDGDGDAELLVGQAEGYLKLYRNDGGAGGPPNWTRWWGNFDRLGLGSYTAPNLGDADGDGDLDIVVGLGDGTLKGIINGGTASSHAWVMDDKWVDHLSRGLTKAPCDAHSAPCMVDVDYDGDTDLLLGSDDGKVMVFENVATGREPRWTRLDVSYHAGVVTASPWEGNSTPTMVDIDGDGDRDLLMGAHTGTIFHYSFDGNTTPAKGHNNLQPLLNGTYRHVRDKDGNDGPFVVEGYGQEFYGYYVLANPRNGYAALRYIPNFDFLAYKHEYWGDEYKFAGGNVSYYPYEPVAQEYVTRALITSNAMDNGVSGGTFISQTGTSAGFVMQPMVSMVYESDEILLLDRQRQADPADYDSWIEPLKRPLEVQLPLDLSIIVSDTYPFHIYAKDGGAHEALTFFALNTADEMVRNVSYRVVTTVGEGATARTDAVVEWTEDLRKGGINKGVHLLNWDWDGRVEINISIDVNGTIDETDELNNHATVVIDYVPETLPYREPLAIAPGLPSSVDPDAIVRGDGKLYVVWETCQGKEEIDIEGRSYDPIERTLGPIESIVSGSHYAVEPDLALDEDGVVHMAYSSNIGALEKYHETSNAKYYWGEKYDLWVAEWDQGVWQEPARRTRAVDYDHSDQAPAVVPVGGEVDVFFRNTRFEFYTGGNQMNNIPFQEMDVRMIWSGQGTHQDNVTMSVTDGSQAWWGGPDAAPWGDDKAWVVYASEVGNSQWDIYAEAMGTYSSVGLVRLTNSNSADEVRPAIAGGGSDPEFMVAYEATRGGDRDIAVRMRSANPDPTQGWGPEVVITTDPADDMKPSVAYDGNGSYWIAWESYRTGNKDIFMSRFDGSDWHGPYRVTYDWGADEQPVVTCDQLTGRVYLVWESDRNRRTYMDIYMREFLMTKPVVRVDDPPAAREDSPVRLTGSAPDQDNDVRWVKIDWGDGSVTRHTVDVTDYLNLFEAEHVYGTSGDRTVTVTALDGFGLESDPVQVTIDVGNAPPVAVLGGDQGPVEDAMASFTALGSHDTPSDGPALTIEWDFGDGATAGPSPLAEAANASHTYTESGTYTVTVTITDDDGDTGVAELAVTVVNLPPEVTAWFPAEVLEEDEEGEFFGRATDTPSDTARGLAYEWDWGDGTTTGPQPQPEAVHAYTEAGTYTATLRAFDDDGDAGTASLTLGVGNVQPSLEVTGPTEVDEDGVITLTATGTDTPSDQVLLEYQWDWGDGTVTDWYNATEMGHAYTATGSYEVTVRVRDDDAWEAVSTVYVYVSNPPPVAQASASATVVAEGGIVHLSAEGSTDTPSDADSLTYSWDLGTTFVEAFKLDQSFERAGTYTITLVVTDDDGATSRATLEIVVTNNPPAAAGWVGPLEVRVGQLLRMDGTNSTDDEWDIDGLKFTWTAGDGTTYRTATASHIYMMPGVYPVRLVVEDGDGDDDVWTAQVTVLPAEEGGGGDGGTSWVLAAGIGVLVLVVILVLLFLVLRARAGPGGEGGDEEAPPGPDDGTGEPTAEATGAEEEATAPDEEDGPEDIT